ncbi:MAG: hypothetical protein CL406_04470 [Acidimicrobiaceae bacterium]|nr:hypothetical protein [Acidimicrobiaceae bacterium]
MPPADAFRFQARIRPRARSGHVGGTWGPDGVLLVAVDAPAMDGKANLAVIKALADALGVPRRSLTIVGGERSRNKVLELADPPSDFTTRLERLLAN